MKRLVKIVTSSLLVAMMFSFNNGTMAQNIGDQNASVVSNYDPISATLDSLVNLTYIQRLQSNVTPANTFKSYEVPTYSADIYKRRMEKIQTPIPLVYNNQVEEYIDLYGYRKRQLTERVMGLGGLYFPLYEQILDQEGLPLEFKYLSIVESALNPMATSRVGATGLWQFMLSTGKLYGLQVNSYIDERRDPEKSTRAACQYFKDMYAIYNDWLLVIAAYNCGAGNVNRAIKRSGGKTNFWEISKYLPKETRGYVPAFIAVTYLMNYTSEHNLIAVAPLMSFYDADTVMTNQKVSLKSIADVTGTPLDVITYLNPMYKKGIIPESEQPLPLRLPSKKINVYLSNLNSIYQPQDQTPALLASETISMDNETSELVKKVHKVKKGEHLQSIANRYNCTVGDLKSWNKLKSTKLASGQKLTVYVLSRNKSDKVVENKPKPEAKTVAVKTVKSGDSKTVWHTVQAGDSLWKIAQRYDGATVEQIRSLNNLQSDHLKVGSRIKVTVNG
jgi:membrane-bound lytic murein transglycosylase D